MGSLLSIFKRSLSSKTVAALRNIILFKIKFPCQNWPSESVYEVQYLVPLAVLRYLAWLLSDKSCPQPCSGLLMNAAAAGAGPRCPSICIVLRWYVLHMCVLRIIFFEMKLVRSDQLLSRHILFLHWAMICYQSVNEQKGMNKAGYLVWLVI